MENSDTHRVSSGYRGAGDNYVNMMMMMMMMMMKKDEGWRMKDEGWRMMIKDDQGWRRMVMDTRWMKDKHGQWWMI